MTLDELNSMLPPEQRKLATLNQSQTSSLLGLSNSTLTNWRSTGVGLEYIKVGKGKRNRILYLKTKLLEFLNSQNIQVS
ncbi:helix-turn-helix domain-containing protein [Aliarcobacter butzleri]|uniref:helix-turn-helix domain-containing protein n=1 Tax=Aliarcobacter butzleri TaxID=28197 RepID=UPI001EDB86AC|nr:helix-turn-helix domain-containing protein [Aliarcobacter butzleri]MCG3690323.1 helix-turn-helix domain-containing protein [Aliarcobacter butzleri]